jgi:hypothetical protein
MTSCPAGKSCLSLIPAFALPLTLALSPYRDGERGAPALERLPSPRHHTGRRCRQADEGQR